jgi:hypothetical protein
MNTMTPSLKAKRARQRLLLERMSRVHKIVEKYHGTLVFENPKNSEFWELAEMLRLQEADPWKHHGKFRRIEVDRCQHMDPGGIVKETSKKPTIFFTNADPSSTEELETDSRCSHRDKSSGGNKSLHKPCKGWNDNGFSRAKLAGAFSRKTCGLLSRMAALEVERLAKCKRIEFIQKHPQAAQMLAEEAQDKIRLQVMENELKELTRASNELKRKREVEDDKFYTREAKQNMHARYFGGRRNDKTSLADKQKVLDKDIESGVFTPANQAYYEMYHSTCQESKKVWSRQATKQVQSQQGTAEGKDNFSLLPCHDREIAAAEHVSQQKIQWEESHQ